MTPAEPANIVIGTPPAQDRPADHRRSPVTMRLLLLGAAGLLLAETGPPAAMAQERAGQGSPASTISTAPVAQLAPLPPLAPSWPATSPRPAPAWPPIPAAPLAPDRSTAPAAAAPPVRLSAVLKAVTVDLGGDSGSNVYRAIWHDVFDQELAIRQKFSEKTNRPVISTTNVFAANFDVPQGKIVVSATDVPGNGCQSYTNIGLSPSLMTCPMRIALVQSKEIKIIYSSKSFPFSIGVNKEGEFDNENPASRTSVTLDPVKKILRTYLSQAGPHIEGFALNADNTTIRLEY